MNWKDYLIYMRHRKKINVKDVLTIGCGLPPAPDMPQTTHRILNEHGRYEGRIDGRGRVFDQHGKYKGKIERR